MFTLNLGSSITTLEKQTMVLIDRLSEIMMPTLVIWGARDPIVPVSQAYTAAQLIPNCQVKVFEDCPARSSRIMKKGRPRWPTR